VPHRHGECMVAGALGECLPNSWNLDSRGRVPEGCTADVLGRLRKSKNINYRCGDEALREFIGERAENVTTCAGDLVTHVTLKTIMVRVHGSLSRKGNAFLIPKGVVESVVGGCFLGGQSRTPHRRSHTHTLMSLELCIYSTSSQSRPGKTSPSYPPSSPGYDCSLLEFETACKVKIWWFGNIFATKPELTEYDFGYSNYVLRGICAA